MEYQQEHRRQVAETYCFMKFTVGSKLHGLAVDGTDDTDLMALCVEPPLYVIGHDKFEHYVHRTKPEGVRSGPGDIDLTYYSLRKWSRLALSGNPTLLVALFVPRRFADIWSPLADDLQSTSWMYASKSAGNAFHGYMVQQKERLVGDRGGRRKPSRPELVEKYGYDTKYAGHVVRLGLQGIEFLETGRLTLPMGPTESEEIVAIRTGKVPLEDVIRRADDLEARIKKLMTTSALRDKPDTHAVNSWLVRTYTKVWELCCGTPKLT